MEDNVTAPGLLQRSVADSAPGSEPEKPEDDEVLVSEGGEELEELDG